MTIESGKEIQAIPGNDIMASASHAEATIQRAEIILKLIAKHIRPTEIRLFGSNLHFERGACEKILAWAGANLRMDHKFIADRIMDEKGEVYYDYEIWGTIEVGGRVIDIMGNCSTRSDFFGTKDGNYKPLSEVDIPSIKQAAISNLWNHACIRSLGLKSLTIDDLQGAGMDTAKIAAVTYAKGSQGGSTITPEEKAKQTLIGNMILEMNGGDKEASARMLEKATAFKAKDGSDVAGVKSCANLTGKRLDITYSKVRTEYQKHCEENGIPVIQLEAKK